MTTENKIELLETFFERKFFIQNKLRELQTKLTTNGYEHYSDVRIEEGETQKLYDERRRLEIELGRLNKYIKLLIKE